MRFDFKYIQGYSLSVTFLNMNTLIVSSKKFRQDFPKYQELVEKGVSITIVKRSKPIFKIEPVDTEFNDQILDSLLDYEAGKNLVDYDSVFSSKS